jgi:hypothetical protein
MSMAKLSQTDAGIAWLRQFQVSDQKMATTLLDAIVLVSASEFTDRLRKAILDRASRVNGLVGLYAERELRTRAGVPHKLFKETKGQVKRAFGAVDAVRPLRADSPEVGSEGLIAQMIAELARQHPRRFRSHPGPGRIRRDKVRSFFLVTDFIGSGRRARTFLDAAWRVASVRSWWSFGWLRFSVVAYSGTDDGGDLVRRHGCQADVTLVLPAPTVEGAFERHVGVRVRSLCIKYDPVDHHPSASLGYGGTGALIAFAHGCPNNAPRLLHAIGRSGWRPMFPGRVTADSTSAFGSIRDAETIAARVARLGEKRLATGAWITETSEEGRLMVALLASLARGPRTDEVLARRTGLTLPEVALYLARGAGAGWIAQDRRLTDAGIGELRHARAYQAPKKFVLPAEPAEPYYPTSLRAPCPV